MTAGGIIALRQDDLDATPDGGPRPLRFLQIGLLDRVVPHQGPPRTSPRVVSDSEGRLYFATVDSVVIVDPSTVTESSLRPTIVFESIVVDSQPMDTSASAHRFTAPTRVQFEYTSLSLRSPETIRFRYKLEGHDKDWVEAGGARQAIYGTLPAGAYRFHVIGTSSEGVWNEDGATYAFQIVPMFYDTWWFRALAIGLVATALVVTHRLRVRRLTRLMDLRFEERLAERTRIAQDLHDTLLQGALAASMHVQVANDVLDEAQPSPVVEELRSPLRRATQLLHQVADESRAALSGLRSGHAEGDLAELLHQTARNQASHDDIEFRVTVDGKALPLKPLVVDDVGRIAKEAIVNAYKHSGARLIEVELVYTSSLFTCIIRDNGQGIQQPVVDLGREGHWGLPGMRERAERLGGELHLRSSTTAGTEVQLLLDGRLAYDDDGS